MVGGAVEDKDSVVSPVRILAVELTREPMEESSEDPTVVAPLTEREVSPTAGVHASDERQSMAQGLRQLPEAGASLSPAVANESRLRQVGFIHIEDALASHHLLKQSQGELLALVSAADGVGAGGKRLRPLEAQT